jgi:hypothetical protein
MDSLDLIVLDTWRAFLPFIGNDCIITPSIPVLWFGDHDAYTNSQQKIVTVSINPSYKEFIAENEHISVALRFPKAAHLVGKKYLSSSDLADYRSALNSYFSENPYMRFFSQWAKYLAPLAASFYTGAVPNTAIHIDLFTPLATSDTWNNMNKADQRALKSIFKPITCNLLSVLKPDVIFSSCVEIFDLMGISSTPLSPRLYMGHNNDGQTVLYGKNKGRIVLGQVEVQDIQSLVDTLLSGKHFSN